MNKRIFFFLIIILFVSLFYASDKLNFEFTERLRYVNWNNAIDLNDEISDKFSFTRQKTTFSLNWKPSKKINFKFKLANENRVYFLPDNRDYNIDEIFFDQLYVKFNKLFGLPLSLTIGRQNIIMGEGFLLLDYNPLDGSRSVYFNAIRGDYKISRYSSVTIFYGYQDVNDNYLPILNPKDRALIEQPEEGMGIYYKGLFNRIKIETYYIRKNIDSTDSNPLYHGINTFGFRSIIPLKKKLTLTSEAAIQSGYIKYSSFRNFWETKRRAFGGYFHLDYKLKTTKFTPVFTLGGFYLSGDDVTTRDVYESWDPLFSRWPKWSESYIYTLIKERKVAYWSNIISIYAQIKIPLSKKILFNCALHKLYPATYTNSYNNFVSGNGNADRGILFTSRLNIKLKKNLSGHIVFETFKPGDFYVDGASSYYWLRFELLYKFKSK